MQRLNGWQRIGLVLSALWVPGISGLASYEYFETFQYNSRMKECRESLIKETNAEKKRMLEFLCADAEKPLPNFFKVLASVVLPVVVAWLFVYVIIWTIKWVIAGFNSRKGI